MAKSQKVDTKTREPSESIASARMRAPGAQASDIKHKTSGVKHIKQLLFTRSANLTYAAWNK